jgi:ABC-2 type transport system permease protein
MKRLRSFLSKEFMHIFRDKRSMLILFGMPVVQLLLFGYVITNEIKNANVAIYDKSKDAATKRITNALDASDFFVCRSYVHSDKEVFDVLRSGRVKMVVVFEPNFERNLVAKKRAYVQVIADATEPNIASSSVNYTSSMIGTLVNSMYGQDDVKGVVVQPRMVFNEKQENVYMFVPGTMALILMLISAMMTSITIAREKERGTMEILLVSPLNPSQIILGKVLPYFLLSFFNAIVILLISRFVFGLPMLGSYILLLAESMLFILMALSLGIFISTAAKSEQQAMFLSMFALMLPTMLLSGFIYPVENMPSWLQVVCNIMPPTWFIIIVKSIMLKGSSFAEVWKETLVIAAFTVLFIAMSIKKFKIRLE